MDAFAQLVAWGKPPALEQGIIQNSEPGTASQSPGLPCSMVLWGHPPLGDLSDGCSAAPVGPKPNRGWQDMGHSRTHKRAGGSAGTGVQDKHPLSPRAHSWRDVGPALIPESHTVLLPLPRWGHRLTQCGHGAGTAP